MPMLKKRGAGLQKVYVVKVVQDFLHPQSLKLGPAFRQETAVLNSATSLFLRKSLVSALTETDNT